MDLGKHLSPLITSCHVSKVINTNIKKIRNKKKMPATVAFTQN